MAKQKIFLSYSRQDGSQFAVRLAADLQSHGYDVWLDQEDLRAGVEWDTEIEKALAGCDCLLFLETEKSVISVTCLDEVHYALENDKKVIPLIFVDSKTPFRLNRLQHIDFVKNYDKGLAHLLSELEGNPQAVEYPLIEEKQSSKLPFSRKNYWPLVVVTCLAVLVAVILLLTSKSKPAASAESTQLIPPDAVTKTQEEQINVANDALIKGNQPANQNSEETANMAEDKRNASGKSVADKANTASSRKPSETKAAIRFSNLNELVAGDWKLVGVEPKAKSQNGYIKIETNGDKATIKSYMQFYYPESEASSHLTIFNAFAGCASCVVNEEMKLKVEDVAIGSRTIKRLEEDQADGRKAGEIILDAGSNKSINANATLRFVDHNHAILTVKQPLTIELAHGLMLQPFVYAFRFRKTE